jgi:alpha-glucosidase
LALMLTLRGTPFLYYGEEIGMTDLILEEISQFRDMLGIWIYEAEKRELSASHSVALKHAAELTRDKCRTPMQWANAPNAGFCPPQVQPWLPIHPGYSEGVNVEQQKSDNDSLLEFYRRMLNLRKSLPALIAGDYRPISYGEMVDEKVLAFLRNTPEQTILVAMNFSITPQTIILPTVTTSDKYRLIFSTRAQMERIEQTKLELAPFEVAILEKTWE